MSGRREDCNIETWPISRLVDACRPSPEGRFKVSIPDFQRGLVWNTKKQKGLIDSINEGYPVGSLLLYEGNESGGKRQFSIVDGLQRTHAIRSFVANPNRYFSSEDVDENLVDTIVTRFPVSGPGPHDRVRKLIETWVKSCNGFAVTEGWGVSDLTKHLLGELLGFESDSTEFHLALGRIISDDSVSNGMKDFLDNVQSAADIKDVRLSVIHYSGHRSKLPRIFELLNSRGVSLSRYDIFSASWIDFKTTIRNEKVREAIYKKYAALVEEGFTSEALNSLDDGIGSSRHEYSLYEFLFGFGQFLSLEFPDLFAPVKEDAPNSYGFNLVTACVGLRLNQMLNLETFLTDHKVNLNELCEHIVECVSWVENCLKSILSVNQRKQPLIFHAELQIISFIATVFTSRYEEGTLKEKAEWKSISSELASNFRMYFLYDIIRQYWRGSGDSKLHDDVLNQRYARRPPTRGNWFQTLNSWYEDTQISMQHKRRYVRMNSPEILLLKYIYVRKFTAYEVASEFHVEHVIPNSDLANRAKLEAVGWPINCVGNLALLEKKQNQRKGGRTYYDYWIAQRARNAISDSEFEDNVRADEDKLLCPRAMLPEDPKNLDRRSYESFLNNRFGHLRKEFFELWTDHISEE